MRARLAISLKQPALHLGWMAYESRAEVQDNGRHPK